MWTMLRAGTPALMAVAAIGLVSFTVHLGARRYVDVDRVPARVLSRMRWWNEHAAAGLAVSLTTLAAGMLGFLASR